MSFDPSHYRPMFTDLLAEQRLPPLDAGKPNQAVRDRLKELTVSRAFGSLTIRDTDMTSLCLAGIWLYHDYLDECHTICQEIETPSGSYWHALMHRRERDFSNSKYWFRRVGNHPVFEPLAAAARELAAGESHSSASFLRTQKSWDPFAFVDLCEASLCGKVPCEKLCRVVQQREWEMLFDHCYRAAIG